MIIIDGNKIATVILTQLRTKISEKHLSPRLDIIFVGDNPASEVYVNKKISAGKEIGIKVVVHKYEQISHTELSKLLEQLNNDSKVHGIILQLPLSGHRADEFLDLVSVHKDVDGLNSANIGLVSIHSSQAILGATPKAILHVLGQIAESEDQHIREFLTGKKVLIINRSRLIGKPLAMTLANLDATVTIAHSKSQNIEELIAISDIIISGTGIKGIISSKSLKKNVVLIDAGFTREENSIHGDISGKEVSSVAAYLSPVPGGIGPIGVAMLMHNTYEAAIKAQS